MTFENPWFTFLLISITGLFLLEMLSAVLTLRRLSPTLPSEFEGTWDAAAYAKSQAYTREGERFGMISATWQITVALAFWLGGGYRWLDALTCSWFAGEIPRGLAGLSLLMVGSALLNLPFELWDTFHIEARYGFNRTTPRTFVADKLKVLLLMALVGLPVCALLIWIFEKVDHAWVWAWLSVAGIKLILQFVGPTWLMPLFNKFTPLPEGSLKESIKQLAVTCDFPVKEVFVMDGSKRSSKANASFAGFGKNKRIALYDTLVEKHTEPELIAVLAHEIGHFKCRHILQRLAADFIQLAVFFLLMGWLLKHPQIFLAFGVHRPSVWLSLVFFMQISGPVTTLTGVLYQYWSRRHEFEADRYAARATGSPQPLISALKRLSVDSLSNLTPHPLTVWLSYSHPPLPERLAALRATAEEQALPQPGG